MNTRLRWAGKEEVLLKAASMGSSPFGKKGDYEDYEGFSIPPRSKLIGKRFDRVDLSQSTFSGTWIEKCSFGTALFARASFAEATDHGNSFSDCRFEKTDFRAAQIGYDGSTYGGCQFIGCNFARTGFIRAEFTDCTFTDCKLKGVDFSASSFEQCTFEGILDEVWFRGDYMIPSHRREFGVPRPNTMKEVSFERAELRDVTFSDGCPLGAVVLPAKGHYAYVQDWKRRLLGLETQASLLSGAVGKELGVFVRVHLVHAENQPSCVLNYDDIVRGYGGEEVAKIVFAAVM